MNTDKIYAEHIANQYAKTETSKVRQLKKLDMKAKKSANIFAYTFGIGSSLVLGTGMSLVLGAIGTGTGAFIAGIVVGTLGLIGCGLNYLFYNKLLQKGKNKYASDIIRLANEIADEK